ncbi:CYTH domain-containing protein [Pleionea sediminis]|uniref:CYTH domain-containing protein n=1 Tax=Pleionea sediminis TaxID=2569479 RepID=UPI001186391B|nr:CYTH domain-containing protein [Pleionea sediminis]
MGKEIERKFLVNEELLPPLGEGNYISQGYIDTKDNTVVRARIKGDVGYLTLKGESDGISCLEFEYEIPLLDAQEIIEDLCKGKSIEKTRYELKIGGHLWEIDRFHGENEGLIIAEVELEDENDEVELPEWIKKEVSGKVQYYNSSLLIHPYKNW